MSRGGRRAHARKPRPPLRRRIRRWLPGRARGLALLLGTALTAGLVYLLNGPLLRVEEVEWSGTRFTPPHAVEARLAGLEGRSLLALDTTTLEAGLNELPGIADVRVDASLPESVNVAIDEHDPVMVWVTETAVLALGPDGGVVGEFADQHAVPDDVFALPRIDDARRSTRDVGIGEAIDPVEAASALRLATLEPAFLGSDAPTLAVRVDELYGFVLVSPSGWEAALGFYGREPGDDAETAAARVERQIAAIRTLFAGQPEQSVAWLDARNPGKIYFRATATEG